jgi:hypothetical protein
MNRDEIRAVIDGVTGAPVTGQVAAVVPAIVDALDLAINPPAPDDAKRNKRVIEADETR